MNNLRKLAENINIQGQVLYAVPLSEYTTFKLGGKADVFFIPQDFDDLRFIFAAMAKEGLRPFVLGGGSNLVVSDLGIDGGVLYTGQLNSITHQELADGTCVVECQCGVLIEHLMEYCQDNALSGMENFSGLPGTVGGAVYMNARCYEKSVSDVLLWVDYLDLNTIEQKKYSLNADDWDYKKSPFQSAERLVLSAQFKLNKGCGQQIAEKNSFYVEDRRSKGHFRYPSAGSVFKNNRSFGEPSGKIIDQAGLRGYTIGGAQVAPWHGNFIINLGNARATDIKNLVEHVVKEVKLQRGFCLECEILFVGQWT